MHPVAFFASTNTEPRFNDVVRISVQKNSVTKFIARINPNSTVTEGEEIELKINPSKLHFFEPDNGNVI